MRVNVQLVDAETGNHLWAERFDKPLADLLDMQDEIVARLANQLGAVLTTAEAHRAERAPNPDSLDCYFQGLAWLNRGPNRANMDRARGFFERALALDPSNVDALLGVGRLDYEMGASFLSDDRDARLAASETTIAKVLSLRPNDALAHEIMGGVLNQTKRSDRGIAEFERALALNPNLATAHGHIGLAKIFVGRAEETEAHVREALRLSPLDSFCLSLDAVCGRREVVAWRRRGGSRAIPALHRDEPKSAACSFLSGRRARESWQAGRGEGRDTDRTDARSDFNNRSVPLRSRGDNPVFLKYREHVHEGMRKAGVPER